MRSTNIRVFSAYFFCLQEKEKEKEKVKDRNRNRNRISLPAEAHSLDAYGCRAG